MIKAAISGFLEAVSALTILPVPSRKRAGRDAQPFFFIAFPLIGLLFGIFATFFVGETHQRLPVLTAWLVPMFWLILSGGAHFIGLCKASNAVAAAGSNEQRLALLTSDHVAAPGAAMALLFLAGKVFAILQAGLLLDSRTVALVVLLTPVISRYTAVMLALGKDTFAGDASTENMPKRPIVILGASLITIAAAMIAPALGLVLVVCALLTAMIIRWIAISRMGVVTASVLGALIEAAEVVMIWVPVISAGYGLNVAVIEVW